MQPPLGIGIIGAGVILQNHALAYRGLPELARLIAVSDIDQGRATAAKREHGFQHSYADYRDLLNREDIDVVSVCTPPHVHTPVVVDCLAAGKHVLCEKPISRTLAEADQAIQAADLHPEVKFSTVYQYRTDPAHERVREMIRNESLGRIMMATLRVRAQRTPAYYATAKGRGSWATDGGGVLINQAVHQLDALISFLGAPVEVSAVMNTFLQPTEGEDTLVGWVRFENGAFATIDCTVCAHEEWFAIEVLGENAQVGIKGEPGVQYCTWTVQSKSSAVQRALSRKGLRDYPDLPRGPKPSTILAQKVVCKLRGQTWMRPKHWGHTPHVKRFLESVVSSKAVPVDPREARKSLELAVALYASALSGEPVQLPILSSHPFYNGVLSQAARTTPMASLGRE